MDRRRVRHGHRHVGILPAKKGSSALGKGLPTTSAFTVVEAAGWLDGANNSCLKAEAAWATSAAGADATPYDLYLFVNSPDTTTAATALAASGPKAVPIPAPQPRSSGLAPVSGRRRGWRTVQRARS